MTSNVRYRSLQDQTRHATPASNAMDARKTTIRSRRTTFYKSRIFIVISFRWLGLLDITSQSCITHPILGAVRGKSLSVPHVRSHRRSHLSEECFSCCYKLPRAEFPELTDIDFLFFPATVLSLLVRKKKRRPSPF